MHGFVNKRPPQKRIRKKLMEKVNWIELRNQVVVACSKLPFKKFTLAECESHYMYIVHRVTFIRRCFKKLCNHRRRCHDKLARETREHARENGHVQNTGHQMHGSVMCAEMLEWIISQSHLWCGEIFRISRYVKADNSETVERFSQWMQKLSESE